MLSWPYAILVIVILRCCVPSTGSLIFVTYLGNGSEFFICPARLCALRQWFHLGNYLFSQLPIHSSVPFQHWNDTLFL